MAGRLEHASAALPLAAVALNVPFASLLACAQHRPPAATAAWLVGIVACVLGGELTLRAAGRDVGARLRTAGVVDGDALGPWLVPAAVADVAARVRREREALS